MTNYSIREYEKSIKIVKNDMELKPTDRLKVSIQGDKFAEGTYIARKCRQAIKKISKNEYVVLKTGEVRQFSSDSKGKNNSDLKKTFGRLMGLIRNNFNDGTTNQLFVTLTYKENMKDPERLYKDYDRFMKRLKYFLKGHVLDYIAVAEPQGRGAWHFHVLLKSDQEVLYIDNKDMERLWGQGFTDTERLKSDDVGTYYVAYFTDVLSEGQNAKARQKGSRLKYYPKGFNFYRASRGIAKPKVKDMTYEELIYAYGEPRFLATFDLVEGEQIINSIAKVSFKK